MGRQKLVPAEVTAEGLQDPVPSEPCVTGVTGPCPVESGESDTQDV